MKGVVVGVKQALVERMSRGASAGREQLAVMYRRCLYYQQGFRPITVFADLEWDGECPHRKD